MRWKFRLFFLFSFVFIPVFLFSQESRLDSLQKALSLCGNDTSRVNTLIAICWEHRLTMPETAINSAEQAISLARDLKFKNGEAKALNNIGVVYHLQGTFDKALQNYKAAALVYEQSGNTKGLANVAGNMASVYQAKGNSALALEYYTRSIGLAKKAGDNQRIAISLGSIGIIYYNQGLYSKSLAYYFQSLSIRESLGDKQGMAYVLGNIGLIYDAQRNYPMALQYYYKSLKIRQQLDDKRGIATALINIGMVYFAQNQFDKSLDYFLQALKISEECGFKKGLAAALNNTGDVYREKKQFEKAAENYEKSLKINEEMGDAQGIASAYHSLGIVNNQIGKTDVALNYFEKSLQMARELNNKEIIVNNYREIADLYPKLGNFSKAYEYANLYASLKDSLYSEESLVKLADMQVKYETDRKEREIVELSREKELQELKISRNNIFWVMGGALFLLILGLAITLFYSYRHRQRIRQLTLKRESELALLDSEKKYKDLADLLPQIVIEMDKDGKLKFINHAGLEQTGYVYSDIAGGLEIKDLFIPQDHRNLEEHISRLMKGELLQGQEFIARRNNNTVFPAVCYFSLATSKDEITGLRGIIIDISELKQLERQILNKVVETEERERKRFAKDLHDGLGPLLSSIKIYVNEIQDEETSAAEKIKMLKYTNELIDEAVNDARTIANNLMPSVIADYGLIRALQSFCDKIRASKTVNISFLDETISKRYNSTIEITLYRIALELINNTIKHASAHNIEIHLIETDKVLELNYKDDGIGFDVNEKMARENGGLGLNSILNRIKSINGQGEFRSQPGSGLMVRMEIDLQKFDFTETTNIN
jgi:PAS domain S-box-containing protein